MRGEILDISVVLTVPFTKWFITYAIYCTDIVQRAPRG